MEWYFNWYSCLSLYVCVWSDWICLFNHSLLDLVHFSYETCNAPLMCLQLSEMHYKFVIIIQVTLLYYAESSQLLPSVLWCCWLGGRKSIWPVKTEGEVLSWLSVWSEVQMICIWSSWCHCRPIIPCSSKIQNSLPFWCRLTQVGLEKRPLNGCSVVVVSPFSICRFWLLSVK